MIEKYTTDDLDRIIEAGCEGRRRNADAWARRMLNAITDILKQEPLRYRSYGPYWWPLKQELINIGETAFGDFIDQEWLEKMDYGKTEYNVAAAFAYEENQFNLGLQTWPYHDVEDDGNPFEFVSADPDME